ncbi:MAG: hypothetical protein ACI915_001018 [Gammaproteobacteria bacterium]|jgi:hypothetical protein
MSNLIFKSNITAHLLCAAMLCIGLSGCIGTIIETATDATLAVVKAPFKVGGAIVDVIDGDDD